MGKNRSFKLLKQQIKTPEGWIRLLREQPLPNMAHVVYCPRCARPKMLGLLPKGEDISKCWRCGKSVLVLDKPFYSALSKSLLHCFRRDKNLFARVKSELPDLPFPELEGPLTWLKGAWDNAPQPPGRPHETRLHLFLSSWIDFLSAPRVELTVTEGRLTPCHKAPHMSFNDAIDVLRGDYPSVGGIMNTPTGRQRKFGGLNGDALRKIHEEFTEKALKEFGVVPSLETREVQRVLQWYRRWREVKHRIQGNKVRGK